MKKCSETQAARSCCVVTREQHQEANALSPSLFSLQIETKVPDTMEGDWEYPWQQLHIYWPHRAAIWLQMGISSTEATFRYDSVHVLRCYMLQEWLNLACASSDMCLSVIIDWDGEVSLCSAQDKFVHSDCDFFTPKLLCKPVVLMWNPESQHTNAEK